jgi:hypothetical protein
MLSPLTSTIGALDEGLVSQLRPTRLRGDIWLQHKSRGGVMAKFFQIIEFNTSRLDEIEALAKDADARRRSGNVRRITMTADRDHPGHYMNIVEFDSYESAMENSQRSDMQEFAAQFAQLCNEPPTFYNLDVEQVWEP